MISFLLLQIISLNLNIMKKQQNKKICCHKCNQVPQQFIILECDHLICVSCITMLKLKQGDTCPSCQSKIKSSFQTIQNYGSTNLKYQILNQSVKSFKLQENARNKKINNEQIRKSEIKKRLKTQTYHKQSTYDYKMQKIVKQLNKQLQFVEIKYKKAVEQIKSAFQKQIQRFNDLFAVYKSQVKISYYEINSSEKYSINLPKFINEKYQNIALSLQKFENLIFEFNFKTISKQKSYIFNFGNQSNISNYSYLSPPAKNINDSKRKVSKVDLIEELLAQKRMYSQKKKGAILGIFNSH